VSKACVSHGVKLVEQAFGLVGQALERCVTRTACDRDDLAICINQYVQRRIGRPIRELAQAGGTRQIDWQFSTALGNGRTHALGIA
jgi:hypothetical protein